MRLDYRPSMKILPTLCIALLGAGAVQSQGNVDFRNIDGIVAINAPIYEPDGVTRTPSGSAYVQLHAGLTVDSLTPVGVPVTVGYPRGNGPPVDGYYDGGVVSLPDFPGAPGWVWAQVFVWDAQAGGYAEAVSNGLRHGKSDPIQVGLVAPPELPVLLVGLESIVLIPEPSSLTLGLLGLGILWWDRRRKGISQQYYSICTANQISARGVTGMAARQTKWHDTMD